MRAMILFMTGVRKMPIAWQLWLLAMMVINGIGPLFFLSEKVAIVTLSAMIVAAGVGLVLVITQGFTKLLGLMHAPWLPMIILQILTLLQEAPQGHFKQWLLASVTISSLSILIDLFDIISYLRGNRVNLLKSDT